MFIDFLTRTFEKNWNNDAIIWRGQVYSYAWLSYRIRHWQRKIAAEGVRAGSVVILEAEFSPNSAALFLSLIENGCVVVPLTNAVEKQKAVLIRIAQGEIAFAIDQNDEVTAHRLPYSRQHKIYEQLAERNHPGLVLFSSGSTGESKAAVHDLMGILEKFKVPRSGQRTIPFLLYDHIGGVNTMFYTLSNGGCMVTVQDRTPDAVLAAIERYKVELLPTSPTFMNLILLSETYKKYDLRTLKVVTYGTEPMPAITLRRFHEVLPTVRLLQTYGLSEVGILRSKSRSSDSLWVKVGGEGFETRVLDGTLQIRAQSAMLGYLNAPSPFREGGWLETGDLVEVDGEYLRFLGRSSEIINVGGEKVYPAEVENIIKEVDNVADVTVYGDENPIVGQIVCAKVNVLRQEEEQSIAARIKKHCRANLQHYKVPVKVFVTDSRQHGERFKKLRDMKRTRS